MIKPQLSKYLYTLYVFGMSCATLWISHSTSALTWHWHWCGR